MRVRRSLVRFAGPARLFSDRMRKERMSSFVSEYFLSETMVFRALWMRLRRRNYRTTSNIYGSLLLKVRMK